MSVPTPKNKLENNKPVLLENISVSRPLRGCNAALAMRYDDASHDRSRNELNDAEMGADRVATIVESIKPQS